MANTKSSQDLQPLPQKSDPLHPTLHEPLFTQMKRLFVLNLRADQKRTIIHSHMRQDRYMDVFHGPPYDRVQHWNRCLQRVETEYFEVEKQCRQYVGKAIEVDQDGREFVDGKEVEVGFMEFVERVRALGDEIERLVDEIGE